jgi:hypothetical protein
MCEILIKVRDYVNADPVKDRRGVHKKGDIINIKPDGWSDHPNWSQSAYPYANGGKFVLVKVPGLAVETALAYRDSWRDDFAYEIVNSNAQQGRYTVRVYETNAGASGENGLTAEKVAAYLLGWGCTNINFTVNSCEFTFSLWAAVQSSEFWNFHLIDSYVLFNLNGYNSATGVGDVTATMIYEDVASLITRQRVRDAILERGGTIISATSDSVRFTIERSDILQRFRADVKRKAEQVYKRHRYAVDASEVDAVVAAGGMVTITAQQLATRLRDKMAVV